jgi:hypothetical protein
LRACATNCRGAVLFQYRTDDGQVCRVRAHDVNAFLRDTAGRPSS